MAKITYTDKVGIVPKQSHINQWWDDDANQVKTVVNGIDDDVLALQSDTTTLDSRVTQNESDITDLTQNKLDSVQAGQGVTIDNTDPLNPIINSLSNSSVLNSGVLTGGIITINAVDNSTFDVSSGSGYITDWSDPLNPVFYSGTWSEMTGVTIPNIATTTFTSVFLIPSVIVGQFQLELVSGALVTPQDRRNKIVLQTVIHGDSATINDVSTSYKPAYNVSEALLDYVLKLGAINGGNNISSNGANLKLDKNAGETTQPFINILNDVTNPTNKTNLAQTEILFSDSYRDGLGGYIFIEGIDSISPDFYDDGQVAPVPVSNNKFTIQRYYYFGATDQKVITLGQAEYDTLEDAESSIFTEDPDVSPLMDEGVFVSAIVVKEGVTDLSNAISIGDASIIDVELLGGSSGGGAPVGNYVTLDTAQDITADKGYVRTNVQIDSKGDDSLINKGYLKKKRYSNNAVSFIDNLDLGLYDTFDLTLTTDSILTTTNIVTSTDTQTFTIWVTGNYLLTLPFEWTYINGGYDGTKINCIVVDVVNGTLGQEKIYYSIITQS